jgi:hypothetical protein
MILAQDVVVYYRDTTKYDRDRLDQLSKRLEDAKPKGN